MLELVTPAFKISEKCKQIIDLLKSALSYISVSLNAGVFYCEPLILAKELRALAKEYNHRLNTKFEFHKENF